MKRVFPCLVACYATMMIFAGCSKSDPDPNPTPTQPTTVSISNLKVTAMSFLDPSCTCGWDVTSGPDVYFKILDGSGNVVLTGGAATNAVAAPIEWPFTSAYTVTNLGATYSIVVYDQDTPPVDPDDQIGGYTFTFSQLAGTTYPTTLTLQNSASSSLVIQLSVTWQ